ncbi:GNAT family N-acetyltransferase [Agrobacterium pusense]|uniref:GNAT family N-acetyltransferase n=1 Tax=Agrobacterium pusense TaxID=648995 RepID=UPI00384DA9AF
MFVRLALESDIETIVDLARMNCELSTPHLTFSADKVRETCRAYLDRGETTIFVVEDRREVIALLVATINEYRHAAGLYTTQEVMFVRPDKRGSRAAALLIKQLNQWSEMLGAIEITGGNDNKFNSDRTARFLQHFGFEQVGYFMRRIIDHGQEGRRQ